MSEAPAPGWYADPDQPQEKRYWDGQRWLAPVPESPVAVAPMATEQPTPALDPPALAPGWYRLPGSEPPASRHWDGKRLRGGLRASRADEPEFPGELVAVSRRQEDRAFLWWSYILGALIPIYGWGAAIYVGVSESRSAIRRHAFGIAAVALVAAGIYAGIIVSSVAANRDSNVANDLESLLFDHGVFASNVTCAHQGGNNYLCQATINGQTESASVTDDGSSIYEIGISTAGG